MQIYLTERSGIFHERLKTNIKVDGTEAQVVLIKIPPTAATYGYSAHNMTFYFISFVYLFVFFNSV